MTRLGEFRVSDGETRMHLKFATVLVVLAIALSGLGWMLLPYTEAGALLMCWPSLSLSLISIGYVSGSARVYGKQDDGQINVVLRLLHLPFGLLQRTLLRVYWKKDGREPSALGDGLFIGSYTGEVVLLKSPLVIDMTAELPKMRGASETVLIRTLDGTPPDPEEMAKAAKRALDHKGDVLVHCAAGRGRSAAMAIVILVLRGDASDVGEAAKLLKDKRPCVHPREPQLAASLEAIQLARAA